MLTVTVMQPQRPVRNIRVRVDENFPPALPGQKTIHQRNKSSPALSTMQGAAGLKAPAKRTAFGDVSNTINGVRPSKDDGVILVKQGLQVNDKIVPLVVEKKTTTFLKQASRPYSVSNLKGLLTGVSGVASTELPLKPAPTETNTLANSRKTLIKRPATTIFKDVTLPAIRDPALKSLTGAQSATTSIPLTKPSSLPEVSLTAKATDEAHSQPNTASDVSYDDAEKSSMQPGTTSSDVGDSAALRSDGIYIDEEGNVRVYEELEEIEPEHQNQTNYLTSKPTSTSVTKAEMYHAPRAEPLPASHTSDANSQSYGQLPPRAEPEEYWEEEEDENYEEEGYVTARSFRSRGENTTGGATTILFPQLNQKIKREIEAAKQLVEAERTPEEIEDECFDTSMVAEYGDEIFDYMRDLEVSYWSVAYVVQC
jgi:hypothetical protein